MSKILIADSKRHYFSFLASKYVGQEPAEPQLHNIDYRTQPSNTHKNDAGNQLFAKEPEPCFPHNMTR